MMNRSLVFVGALALASAQPAVTLAAPPGSLAPSRPAAVRPHAPAPGDTVNRDDFKVPSYVDVQQRPFALPEHFTLPSRSNPQTPLFPYQRYGWQSPGYLWYPTLFGPGCAANDFLGSPSEQQPSDFTLGSLVDGKSNLLSSPSYDAGFAGGSSPAAASSSPVTFQAGFYPTACGAPGFTNF